METIVSVVGGVGLFLLGMAVMTDGLKALAGTALKQVMEKAAATPLLGTFWGAVITLLVQSSSATTMTTIGLVSAGLLTFPQGLSLVFGANIGTTGTGWLVAAFGVRISLTAAALPIVFVGALLKVVGRGRLAAAGSAIAGFALILVGLSTLQEGMGGLAESLHPSDLPTVMNSAGAITLSGLANVLLLVVVGALMTTVMQSSTAAIAVTLSALYAGAVGLDQALALVIGQNIGTATSSAVAAIGASSTAKRLAVAYIAFKLVAAVIAIVLFPFVTPLIVRASQEIDSTALLAAYHTAYNVVGVAVLLPLMGPFTRLIERLVPERGSAFTKYLDPAALRAPTVAVEAVRRTVERALETLCLATAKALEGAAEGGTVRPAIDDATLGQASEALLQASDFLSKADPPPSKVGHAWYTSTVHALDHANRLAEAVDAMAKTGLATDGPEELSAAILCARSMREATGAAAGLARSAGPGHAADDDLSGPPIALADDDAGPAADPGGSRIASLERDAEALADLKAAHRRATLEMVASGKLTASAAIARVDAVALLNRLAHHAWRAVAHLERAAASPMELEQ
ncbi:MAG: Na/Pi symporter [Roseiarcus sp.]|uniref:Na/Pi cotransporter family protein n=1 Tax=Roseiarcus sp. TaxID=1969460 RepID=UPI003C3DD665